MVLNRIVVEILKLEETVEIFAQACQLSKVSKVSGVADWQTLISVWLAEVM